MRVSNSNLKDGLKIMSTLCPTIEQYLQSPCLLTIDEFNEKYSNFSMAQLKQIADEKYNEMDICVRILYAWCTTKYNYKDTSVHHVIKLIDDWDKRLDNKYLITLCPCCHTAAELGQIPKVVLLAIVKEQEDKYNNQ